MLIWVAINILKMDYWQDLGAGFTITSSFRVNKKSIYMLQGPRIKTFPNCSLRLREYEMTNAREAFLLKGTQIGVENRLLFM